MVKVLVSIYFNFSSNNFCSMPILDLNIPSPKTSFSIFLSFTFSFAKQEEASSSASVIVEISFGRHSSKILNHFL